MTAAAILKAPSSRVAVTAAPAETMMTTAARTGFPRTDVSVTMGHMPGWTIPWLQQNLSGFRCVRQLANGRVSVAVGRGLEVRFIATYGGWAVMAVPSGPSPRRRSEPPRLHHRLQRHHTGIQSTHQRPRRESPQDGQADPRPRRSRRQRRMGQGNRSGRGGVREPNREPGRGVPTGTAILLDRVTTSNNSQPSA